MELHSLEDYIEQYRSQGAPEDQQMLIALMRDAQQIDGGALRQETLDRIASELSVPGSILNAIIRRIPMLRMADAPHRLDMCGGCDGAQELIEDIRRVYQVDKDGVSMKGRFVLRVTGCLKRCGLGPAIRWDGKTYDEADVELIRQLAGV